MSQANVELARRGFEAINSGDVETLVALSHPEVEAIPRILGVEGGDSYRGHDGVRELWQNIFSVFPDFHATVLEIRAVADATISNVRVQGSGGESGFPSEDTVARVARWQGHLDEDVSRQSRSPRSRGAVGVGDVAGERRRGPPGL